MGIGLQLEMDVFYLGSKSYVLTMKSYLYFYEFYQHSCHSIIPNCIDFYYYDKKLLYDDLHFL